METYFLSQKRSVLTKVPCGQGKSLHGGWRWRSGGVRRPGKGQGGQQGWRCCRIRPSYRTSVSVPTERCPTAFAAFLPEPQACSASGLTRARDSAHLRGSALFTRDGQAHVASSPNPSQFTLTLLFSQLVIPFSSEKFIDFLVQSVTQ